MHLDPALTGHLRADRPLAPPDDQTDLAVPTDSEVSGTQHRDDPDLITHLAQIDAAIGEIADRLGAEADRAAARERVIDRQHEDIERLRAVERSGQMRPVIIDLCELRNGLLNQARTVVEPMAPAQVSLLLESFAGMAEEALERCGVAVLPCEPGSPFVAGRHRVTKSVDTDDPALDGTVATVVQDGYAEIDGGRVVAPTRVTVHRVAKTATETLAKEKNDG